MEISLEETGTICWLLSDIFSIRVGERKSFKWASEPPPLWGSWVAPAAAPVDSNNPFVKKSPEGARRSNCMRMRGCLPRWNSRGCQDIRQRWTIISPFRTCLPKDYSPLDLTWAKTKALNLLWGKEFTSGWWKIG